MANSVGALKETHWPKQLIITHWCHPFSIGLLARSSAWTSLDSFDILICFGWQSEDESSVTNVAFPSVSSQVYRHHTPHPAPVRHHTAMNSQPLLLHPLPSTEFIVSLHCNTSSTDYGEIVRLLLKCCRNILKDISEPWFVHFLPWHFFGVSHSVFVYTNKKKNFVWTTMSELVLWARRVQQCWIPIKPAYGRHLPDSWLI